jgi:predicted nucleic acid-binding protein
VREWLIDTGPIVAYLDAADTDHARVAELLDRFAGRLVTTGAVVTEAMYFLSATAHGPRRLAELVGDSGMQVYDLAQPAELHAAAGLMERYSDTPMDYADATLVLLAEALGIRDVLTLDRRGFSTYRTGSRKTLRLVLDDSSASQA